ncbi:hypothetical protein FACS189413_13440 [Bacteroidia bacterium]|nr:hypothetical protein FACS189413_13440 [Bacteroidia bacterium]
MLGNYYWTADPLISRFAYSYRLISMENVPTANSQDDGIMVDFDLKLDVDNEDNKPLISFQTFLWEPNILSIKYSAKTVTITRDKSMNGGQIKHYEYHLYDRLFEDATGLTIWRMRVYLTSNFIFIAVNKENSNNYYLSPIFFGLDYNTKYPDINSSMHHFIKRRPLTFISLGDDSLGPIMYESYIGAVKIYGFSYNELRSNIQQNFQ